MNADIRYFEWTEDMPLPRRSLSRRRGRPKSADSLGKDLGTPELIFKKLFDEAKEPLDLYLTRRIITAHQHWCGIHLRWLYTLRHGLPGVTAIDTTHLGGREIAAEDPHWRQAREQEYLEALTLLKRHRLASLLLRVCVFNEALHSSARTLASSSPLAHLSSPHLADLSHGLDLLSSHWCV